MIDQNLLKISQDFQLLEEIVKDTHLANNKIENQIEKIHTNISVAQSQLCREIIHLSKKGEDTAALEQKRAKLGELNTKIETILKELPGVFHAKETRNIFTRMKNCLKNITIRPLCRILPFSIFGGPHLKREKKREIIKLEKLKKKLIEIEKQQELLRANLSLKNGSTTNKKTQEKNFTKLSLLTTEYENIKEKIEVSSKTNKDNISNTQKAKEMRENCQKLGGERITLTTADQVKLDSIYLDAKKFRKKLSDGGCQQVVLKSNQSQFSPRQINAIYIAKKNFTHAIEVFNVLKDFNAFEENLLSSHARLVGMGWCVVEDTNGWFYVPASELPQEVSEEANGLKKYESHPFFELNEEVKWQIKQGALAPLELTTIDTESSSSGTAILSSGNCGIYEMNKREMMFFLLRNIDVMVFNFRGYEESEGGPSNAGLNLDMEAAYQCAKARSSHPDEKIVFKGLCLGGVISAHVAAHHPKTNIILDQVMSDSNLIIMELCQKYVEKMQEAAPSINKGIVHLMKIVVKIIKSICSIFPSYLNTSKYLAKIDGKKAIFYSIDDEQVSSNQVEKNIQAIVKAGKLDSLTLIPLRGKHCTPFLQIRAYPTDFSNKEAESLRKLIEEKKELASQIQAHKDLQTINNEIEKVKEEIKSREEAISELNKKIMGFDNEISSLKTKNDEDLIEKVERIKKSNENNVSELKSLIRDSNNEISLLEIKKENIHIKEDLKSLEEKSAKLEIELESLNYPNRSNMTGQLQMEHFLKKADLMDPIIPLIPNEKIKVTE